MIEPMLPPVLGAVMLAVDMLWSAYVPGRRESAVGSGYSAGKASMHCEMSDDG